MSKPGLKSNMFYKIVPPQNATNDVLQLCSLLNGVKQYGVELPTNEVKIDLIVIGSVAVTYNGHRIGKGKGYADLGYSIMSTLNVITPSTPLITVVHDCQVFETLPNENFEPHDVPVEIIVTPTRIIKCEPILPKPNCIIWPLISKEKINLLPILQELKFILVKKKC